MDLVIGLVFFLAGWAITHVYYRLSAKQIPEWAKPIIDQLPLDPPTPQRLLELFQGALERGEVRPHPVFGHVACPKCHAPFSEMEEKLHMDKRLEVVSVTCPHCGWSDHTEL